MVITNKFMRESVLFVLLVMLLAGANLFWVNRNYDLSSNENINPIESKFKKINSLIIAGQVIKVELADTPEKQRQGLSGRDELSPNTGMLFVFPLSSKQGFWMKDMKFSIDMIWITEEGRVVFIEHSATPESYPKVFTPDQDAKYVLEVPAGFALKNKLKVGDVVEFAY